MCQRYVAELVDQTSNLGSRAALLVLLSREPRRVGVVMAAPGAIVARVRA